MLDLLAVPLLACLVLTAIHVYLGLHVLARGVIFVDLALAQMAALGISVAFLAGHAVQSPAAYWYALAFAVGGALLFAATRTRRAPIPQEAIIGIVYAVSAAAAVVVVDQAPQGSEHIKQLLVGGILTVSPREVATVAVLYAVVGAAHWAARRPLLEISFDPAGAAARGRRVAWWDVAFYTSFGLVVTSSVRMAGVLLVFAYLIVPATCAALLARSVVGRLAVGWAAGALVSALGLAAAYAWDLPTGATVVTTFGALLGALALVLAARGLVARSRAHGVQALAGVGLAVSVAIAAAGAFLALFPAGDHLWLDWLEARAPTVELVFLTPGERRTYWETRDAVARGETELARLRTVRQDVEWGTRHMDEAQQERLRQFLAGRGEIAAGDRMVLRTLRLHARQRQRLWLGVPLLLIGSLGVVVLLGRRRQLGAGMESSGASDVLPGT
jgi:zinc/manganese transport system permease protein